MNSHGISEAEALLDKVRAEGFEAGKRAAEKQSLTAMVTAFHLKFGHPVRQKPTAPTVEQAKFRVKLIAEEFVELLRALYGDLSVVDNVESLLLHLVATTYPMGLGIRAEDMDQIADALGDLAYVIEGTNLVFGFPSAKVLEAIHRANMDKDPNGPDGKPVKHIGWLPPDIEGVLRKASE